GKGKIPINGRTPEDYFAKRSLFEDILKSPLKETQTLGKYDMLVNVKGGGVRGQVEAIRHGCARALEKANPAFRTVLKSLGFLTRDARKKERKKPGLHKARKRPQFSKR
ncbi:30S ribosomal protein S9, partial [Candidatus Sumerlaeota bacterium]|nr:30S ribosomal protein S9 [Candidatus Sumerlaeota bacterium]